MPSHIGVIHALEVAHTTFRGADHNARTHGTVQHLAPAGRAREGRGRQVARIRQKERNNRGRVDTTWEVPLPPTAARAARKASNGTWRAGSRVATSVCRAGDQKDQTDGRKALEGANSSAGGGEEDKPGGQRNSAPHAGHQSTQNPRSAGNRAGTGKVTRLWMVVWGRESDVKRNTAPSEGRNKKGSEGGTTWEQKKDKRGVQLRGYHAQTGHGAERRRTKRRRDRQ
uniref:Uncharacterized protein n=1 Tax=Knipowitschia caucasica TaxID=637954 RepID=A0AAV2JLX5_KNICA